MKWKNLILGEFSWWRLIRLPIIIYLLLLIIGAFFPYALIFPYRGCSYNTSLRKLDFLTEQGDHHYAYTYHKAPTETHLALFFHGNAEDIGQLFEIQYELLKNGISVMALDYPGYGLSEGKPTEKSCTEAAEALYLEAKKKGYTAENILLWGRSVGGGVATNLAEIVPHKALILESPFSTAFTVKTQVPIVPFDKFDNLSKIKKLQTPLFILHGTEDKLIHPKHSKRLYDAHSGKKEYHLIPEAGHNDLWLHDTDVVIEKLLNFLES